MKLSAILEWAQSPLPKELQELYRNYWSLRQRALELEDGGGYDPYICNIISAQIHKYLRSKGIPTQIHSGIATVADYDHMWNMVKLPDGIYIVDGSYYQGDYTRPVKNIIPGILGTRLTTAGITTLHKLLGVIDTVLLGDIQGGGGGWDYSIDDTEEKFAEDEQEKYDIIASQLTPQEIKQIQGRLLPLLLLVKRINKIDYEKPHKEMLPMDKEIGYLGGKYDPNKSHDLQPIYGPGTTDIPQDEF